jgi:hypothetical protein
MFFSSEILANDYFCRGDMYVTRQPEGTTVSISQSHNKTKNIIAFYLKYKAKSIYLRNKTKILWYI